MVRSNHEEVPYHSLAEKRDDCCRLSIQQAAGRRTRATMMDDGGDMLEQPLVWTVTKK
jgi:hypothetical protein